MMQISGRNGRQKIVTSVTSVHFRTQQQLQPRRHPPSSLSRDGWVMTGVDGCCIGIARLGSCCWLSTLPSTTPRTQVCTATTTPSSFSTATPVLSATNITTSPSLSTTIARSTCFATPISGASLYKNTTFACVPTIWNKLPQHRRSTDTRERFKCMLKGWLFECA